MPERPLEALPLAAPFFVVAVLVACLAVIALWLRNHAWLVAEPERAALAASVDALDSLTRIRADKVATDATARRSLATAAWHYAAVRRDGAEVRDAVDALLDAIAADAGTRAIADASRRLGGVVEERLPLERRAVAKAQGRIDAARAEALQQLGDLGLWFAIAGAVGGGVAAWILRRQVALLRSAVERTAELEQFASRVAHDLVSPLAPVTAGVHLLSNRLRGDPRSQAVARTVRKSVDKVAAIVDELLRFAWSGGRAAPGERADLTAVVESLREELVPAARESGVSLTLEAPPRVQVACSETAIALVLQNLVTNAIKYVAHAPLKIVRASATVLAGKVLLVVEDTGPGVPRGMEKAIFEPYVRDGSAEGIGLGLATVKRIVESRAGRVGVSRRRKGARFWVELPLAA